MPLHPSIAHIPMPVRIRALPLDARGFPVPFFVDLVNGQPDHRVVDARKLDECLRRKRCWICGDRLGDLLAAVIGPMCAVNRVSSEPGSHEYCAAYAVKACPFLSRPYAHRRESGLPEDGVAPPGITIRRNPGVALLWLTRSLTPFACPETGGTLFRVGQPVRVSWWAEGRPATRAEAQHSLDTGLPLLMEQAMQDGPQAVEQLMAMVEQALPLLPAEAA